MKRRTPIVVFTLCLLAGAAVLLVRWASAGSLTGATTHDFGTVVMDHGDTATLEHVFELANTTGQPITIESVKPDCGCMTTHAGSAIVQPGERFRLPITFTFSTLSKKVKIALMFGGDRPGRQTLTVKARGRFRSTMFVSRNTLALRAGTTARPGTLTISAQVFDSYDPPSRPAFETPSQVSVECSGWKLRKRSTDASRSPNLWKCVADVRLHASPLADGAEAGVTVESLPPVRVKLREAGPDENIDELNASPSQPEVVPVQPVIQPLEAPREPS